VPQYLLIYYSLLTVAVLVLVVLIEEHRFRKVFIKHEEGEGGDDNDKEVIGQSNKMSRINNELRKNDDQLEIQEIIACRNISKKKSGSKNEYIVKDITFDLEEGQIMGLLGPSGAGKSTIFKLLSTLTARDSGFLRIAGIDIKRYWDDYRQSQDLDLGFVFQEDVLWEDKTVDENL
jgi:ABC-type bacteriocin/lantibiotic exporter with double-glycine peptidase domain